MCLNLSSMNSKLTGDELTYRVLLLLMMMSKKPLQFSHINSDF